MFKLLSEITVRPNRLRPLNQKVVDQLKASIQSTGLINPVQLDNDLCIVAGAHRYEAYVQLGIEKIEVRFSNDLFTADSLRLIELDENLIRNELTATEVSEHLILRVKLIKSLKKRNKCSGMNTHTDLESSVQSAEISANRTKTKLSPTNQGRKDRAETAAIEKEVAQEEADRTGKTTKTILEDMKTEKTIQSADLAPEVKAEVDAMKGAARRAVAKTIKNGTADEVIEEIEEQATKPEKESVVSHSVIKTAKQKLGTIRSAVGSARWFVDNADEIGMNDEDLKYFEETLARIDKMKVIAKRTITRKEFTAKES